MNELTYKMDKGIAVAYLKKQDILSAIQYFDKYIATLDSLIEKDPDNDELKEERKTTIDDFNKCFFNETRNAFNSQKWLETLLSAKKLLEYDFQEASLFKFLSFCFQNLGVNDLRLDFMKKYSEIRPHDNEINKLLAEAYYECNNDKYARKAIELFEKHLEKYPKDHFVWNKLGHIYAVNIYNDEIQVDKQLECFSKALDYDPNNLVYQKNIALSYVKARRNEEAEEMYQHIFATHRDPFTSDDHFNYAAFRIKCGDFITGFKHYEYRLDKDENKHPIYKENRKPKWNGYTDISNSTLAVFLEQGFGDVVMFIRFIKNILPRAKKVIAIVQDKLLDLFKESDLGFDIYSIDDPEVKKLDFDFYTPLISLPVILKLTPDTITDRQGYLKVSPERKEEYRKKYIKESDKIKIGINFEGAAYGKSQGRDIEWKHIEKFAAIPNVQLYCLNIDKDENFFKDINPNLDIICLGKSFDTFADTAAAIDNMDIVFSTDNVILNLAGAMGKRTFAALNFSYEYRWYKSETGKVVWYDNVASFVNEKQNYWEPTISNAIEAIKKCIKENNY